MGRSVRVRVRPFWRFTLPLNDYHRNQPPTPPPPQQEQPLFVTVSASKPPSGFSCVVNILRRVRASNAGSCANLCFESCGYAYFFCDSEVTVRFSKSSGEHVVVAMLIILP